MKPASPLIPGAFAMSILSVSGLLAAPPTKPKVPLVAPAKGHLAIEEPSPARAGSARPSLAGHGQDRPIRKVVVSGAVVRPDGRPVPDAAVEIYPLASLSLLTKTLANANGEFTAMVPDGPCMVMTRSPGLIPMGKVVMDPADPKSIGLRIAMEPGGFPLKGKVVGPRGNPMSRGEVWVQDLGNMDVSRVYRTELVAGRFGLNLPEGHYRVTIRCHGFAEMRELCAVSGTTERKFSVRALPAAPSVEVKNWVRGHAIPLRTLDPGGAFDDLRPLGNIIGESKIVGLGESTHGTHEFFTFKHRMIEYLVLEKGFSTLLVEEDFGQTAIVDDYVRFGKGDAESVVAGMEIEFWRTEEMVNLIRWMRLYNEDPAHAVKIGFRGIDARNPYAPYLVAMGGLSAIDPEAAAVITKSGFDDAFVRRVRDDLRSVPMEEMAKGLAATRSLTAAIQALEGRVGAAELSRLRMSAVMVGQFFEIYGSPSNSGDRDRLMTENVNLIRQELGRDAKAILWAHNGHVQYGDSPLGGKTMGENLRKLVGKDYVVIVTSFNRGSYRAWEIPGESQKGIMAMDVGPVSSGSFASAMTSAGLSQAAMDLRSIPRDGAIGKWFREPRPEWLLAGGQSSADVSYMVGAVPTVLQDVADVVVFVERTTPSHPQPEYVMPFHLKMKSILPRVTNLDFRGGEVGRPPEGWETLACWGFPKVDATSTLLSEPDGTRFVVIPPRSVQDPLRITVLAQAVDGAPYRGKSVRLSALVKDDDRTKGNPAYAAMWIRNDGPTGCGAYGVRPLPEGGRNEWQRISVTIPVAADATSLVFGFRCGGEGNDHVGLMVRDVTLEADPR